MTVPKLLLKSSEAAEALGICERTLFALRKKGEIACVMIGTAVRFDPRDLQAFIDKQRGLHP